MKNEDMVGSTIDQAYFDPELALTISGSDTTPQQLFFHGWGILIATAHGTRVYLSSHY
jgi:hypothetical protein